MVAGLLACRGGNHPHTTNLVNAGSYGYCRSSPLSPYGSDYADGLNSVPASAQGAHRIVKKS